MMFASRGVRKRGEARHATPPGLQQTGAGEGGIRVGLEPGFIT